MRQLLDTESKDKEKKAMRNVGRIIWLNRMINEAKTSGDILRACKYLKRLRKIEIAEGVMPRAYRV